jgi:hypothetical protein
VVRLPTLALYFYHLGTGQDIPHENSVIVDTAKSCASLKAVG